MPDLIMDGEVATKLAIKLLRGAILRKDDSVRLTSIRAGDGAPDQKYDDIVVEIIRSSGRAVELTVKERRDRG